MKDKIKKEIEKLKSKYINFLSELVRIPSVYGSELKAQNYVKKQMLKLGLEVKEYYSRDDKESLNIAGILKGKNSSKYKSLILNAHCDIAPVIYNKKKEFSGRNENGLLFGRGAQDDKAGIAIILMIVEIIKNLNIELKGDLIIETVIEDETTGNGSKTLCDNGILADGVIICDGTWHNRIIYGHLGQVWLTIEINGIEAPACVEYRVKNPIYTGMAIIKKIKQYILKLQKTYPKFENLDNSYFVNIGSFISEGWHGATPKKVVIKLQIGFGPDKTCEEIIDDIKNICKKIDEAVIVKEYLLKTSSYKTNKNNYLINKLKKTILKNTGCNPEIVAVSGHCDMRHFKTENICLYGPGGGKNAHCSGEYYMLEHFPIVGECILDFIMEWCNETR